MIWADGSRSFSPGSAGPITLGLRQADYHNRHVAETAHSNAYQEAKDGLGGWIYPHGLASTHFCSIRAPSLLCAAVHLQGSLPHRHAEDMLF